MAEKKPEPKTEKVERIYTIPLREKCRVVPRYKKTNKAVKTIKEFIAKHMKVQDRDLNKVKIDGYLNEVVWFRGIKKPPIKVKVKAIKEGDIVRVELAEMPKNLEFKKARLDKRETKAAEATTVAERIRTGIEEITLTPAPDQKTSITVSIGVTEYLHGESISAFVQRADKAMYLSKNQGRNRVSPLIGNPEVNQNVLPFTYNTT